MKHIIKYFYLLLSLLIINCGLSYPQSGWVRQYPPPQAMNIRFLSVSFANADTGFIVGGSGIILHTTNGGIDWNIQTSGTTNWLRGVSAFGPETATAVGDSGIILHTTNGGEMWERQSSGTADTLNAVSFTDADTGTVVGDSGIILRTTNGGTTWVSQASGTMKNLRGVSFTNSNIGTAVGDSGTILRTTNGGTSWASQVDQGYSNEDDYYGVSFTDGNTGTAVGYTRLTGFIDPSGGPGGIIIRTKDGGKTWVFQAYIERTVFSSGPLLGVSFTDANTGTVVGLDTIGYAGVIWRITNNSYSWVNQSIRHNGFYGVCFIDSVTGTVVGDSGAIYHTTTGGVTGIKDYSSQLPGKYFLEQNYPNPFNPNTTINYQIPPNGVLGTNNSFVTLKVFDILGREVKTLVNGYQQQGKYSINFNADNLASGVYFYKLSSGSFTATKKLLLLK